MLVTEARDVRRRTRALQATLHSCASAAAIDALVDITGWQPVQALQAQTLLTRQLGGLVHAGTTLELVAAAGRQLFGCYAQFTVFPNLDLDKATELAAAGAGIVLGLAAESGNGEGHAVRLLGGDFPDLGGFADAPPHIRRLVHPTEAMDMLCRVQVFDPWFEYQARLPELVPYGYLRRRYEGSSAGALIIWPRR